MMLRLSFAKGMHSSRLAAARFCSTVTACPYGRTMAQEMHMPTVDHCPVVGDTPETSCPVEHHLTRKTSLYAMISTMGKTQLSAYVAATALAGYVIGCGTSPLVAGAITMGTMLQSCSANTANQILEREHDKAMKRTCRRPLPMGLISPLNATLISGTELAIGTGMLYMISPTAAALGLLNWFLYVGMYTPLKRVSATNTWFGSIVGGIPPLMGGVAVNGVIAPQVWMLGTFLFVWQIPHFHGLAFHCRRDYEAAGYKMLAFSHPWRASFYSVLMSLVMAFLTLVVPSAVGMEVEGVWYYPLALAANAAMIYKSLLFHQQPVRHCRGCFVFSYVYLSIMLAAFMLNHLQPMHFVERMIDTYTKEESTPLIE
ncbi:protoheme IX farnesyltransferase [Angomonas deanei]|uniref:Heme O synthase n=1 Tax=Angomonas deanei TaxID=59799 RepID=A0A7G2CQP5_9TRYP|nr:protoheme IX farnesyltransferase [Angomonas deanei]CAD2220823.1 UbiA prenyltransferase family, putative [Angomonas deanei]|eukprot:EPY40517.1 protoheme IX farnesyltransferase [Angomonas deanei]